MMNTFDQSTKDDARIISLKEAADYLGVSYSTVRRLVLSGELRAFRVRNSIWRTSTAECDRYVEEGMRELSKCLGNKE
jgi:excisionase family DNA binding protein